MSIVRIKWTRRHKACCIVSSTRQASLSGSDFCNGQSIIMPLVTRFSNMGLSGLWGYNDTSSGNSELRMPPENSTLKCSRGIAVSFRKSRAGGGKAGKERRWDGGREGRMINSGARRKEGTSGTFLLLGRTELLTSWPSCEEQLHTLEKIKQTSAWGLWSLSKNRPTWGKLNKHPTRNVFRSLIALSKDRLRVEAPGSWKPERKPCHLLGHWNQENRASWSSQDHRSVCVYVCVGLRKTSGREEPLNVCVSTYLKSLTPEPGMLVTKAWRAELRRELPPAAGVTDSLQSEFHHVYCLLKLSEQHWSNTRELSS